MVASIPFPSFHLHPRGLLKPHTLPEAWHTMRFFLFFHLGLLLRALNSVLLTSSLSCG